jgi:hypothetical protein
MAVAAVIGLGIGIVTSGRASADASVYGYAGLARAHVTATDPSGKTYELVFEVFVKNLTWWGDAGGETVRDWTLYEVHRASEPCVFPSSAYGCAR